MSPELSCRGAVRTGLITLVVLLAVLVGWGTQTRLAGAVMAAGEVEVDSNRQVVQHPEGGVVTRLLVREGDLVAAGQLLAVLDGQILRSDRRQIRDRRYDLAARRARLAAEREDGAAVVFDADLRLAARSRPEIAEMLDGQTRLFAARRETFDRQSEQLKEKQDQILRQIQGIEAQAVAARRQSALVARLLETQRALFRQNLARRTDVTTLERQATELEGTLGKLAADRAEALSRATETRLEALRLSSARREEAGTRLREIAPQELDLTERLRALDARIDRLEIRAPVSGIVYDLSLNGPQAVVTPAEPILYIVPQDRPLVVSARVPPTAVDDVPQGAQVRMRLTAFSDRFAPDVTGRVLTVTPDRLTDQRTGVEYFRVRIALDATAPRTAGKGSILPGMPVEAFIGTGERSPLSYLLDPLRDYFDHAFREN